MANTTRKTRRAVKKPKPYDASKEELFRFYRDMLLIRRFEEKAGQMYGMGHIRGFCHLYIGQEGVVIGVQSALQDNDTVITGYRDHGHLLAAGIDPKLVLAELTGRAGGISKGKGGSMHMFSKEKNFYGGHGIVGAPVPLGAGLGFAHAYRDEDAVSVTYFGDGAANQGQTYETFNMAALWSLPVLFIVENNQYAMGTSVKRASAQTELFRRGECVGVPGQVMDGMNVLEVRAVADESLKKVRARKGPVLLEAKTYRYRGHSMSDPAKYRTRDEVQKMRAEHDPIDQCKQRILEAGYAKEAELKDIDKEIKDQIAEAEEFAMSSPEPDMSELYTDVTV